jgi:hypothetical protein
MKSILTILLSFSLSASFGQFGYQSNFKEAVDYFKLGVAQFNKTNYKIADSLFTRSLSLQQSKDAYFNRAITRLILNDTCSACKDLLISSDAYFDKNAYKLYSKFCIQNVDTIYSDKNHKRIESKTEYKYYEETITTKCKSSSYGYIHKKNHYSSVVINADLSKSDRHVDIYAEYSIIDSIKYYSFIFNSTFTEDNQANIEAFKERLMQILSAKYKFDSIPYVRRYCSLDVLINSEGQVVKSEINSNPFKYFDKTTQENIINEIITSIKNMPQLKPEKLFGTPVSKMYYLIIGI